MKKLIQAIWPVLTADAVMYAINEATYVFGSKSGIGWLYEIMGYGLVLLAGYLAARESGLISRALLAGAVFWFLWRPLLALAAGLIGLIAGDVEADSFGTGLLGVVGALVLFSPIALAASAIGGFIARMRRRDE